MNGQQEDLRTAQSVQPHKKSKLRKILGIASFVVLNAIVLFFTARADFSKEAPAQAPTFGAKNLLFLGGALLCLALVLGCETLKYLLMMRHLRVKVSVRTAFETAALGKYYDSITPSGAGGQPFQIWHFHTRGYPDGAASAMPLVGFFTMQFGFVFLALLVFVFGNGAIDAWGIKAAAYVGAIAYLIVPLLIVLTAVKPAAALKIVSFFIGLGAKIRLIKEPEKKIAKVEEELQTYSSSLKIIASNKLLLAALLLLSFLFQASLCSIPYFVIRLFGGEIGFLQSLAMTVFVYASVTIVPTPGNSGAAEGSFYILFSQLDTSGLFWAMLVWRLLCYYSFIGIGLLVYGFGAIEKLCKKNNKKRVKHDTR